ncbi:AIDA repeat-containing protein, partial [Paraburkholderia sp. BCC1886]|uniref:AIDA repeat-containing protein n=1 Tax=Paraburkholderia sp. BCC1886 TaxID=2562670 RepID=UPI0011839B74
GTLQVDAGGTADLVAMSANAALITNTSALITNATNRLGSFTVSGNVASNVVAEDGGQLTVLTGGTASATTVGSA